MYFLFFIEVIEFVKRSGVKYKHVNYKKNIKTKLICNGSIFNQHIKTCYSER